MRRVDDRRAARRQRGSSLTVFMHAPWQLDILWGIVNGLATGAVAVPLAAMIANRWFVERRGLVTGVLTASTATGNLIFLPALAAITDAWGWRYTAVTVSAVAFVLVLPLAALLLRDRPADLGARAVRRHRDRAGSRIRRATRSRPRRRAS